MENRCVLDPSVAHISSTYDVMKSFVNMNRKSNATVMVNAITLAELLMKKSDSRVFVRQVKNAPPQTYELEEEYADSRNKFFVKTENKQASRNNALVRGRMN